MSSGRVGQINDLGSMRALAHPTRLEILDLLRVHEALTASRCAELLGLSAKTCSYHLRVLGQHGLVEAVAGINAREHPWRRTFDETTVPLADPFPSDEQEWQKPVEELLQVGLQHNHGLLLQAVRSIRSMSPAWRSAFTAHGRTASMTPEQLRRWGLAVEQVTREHLAEAAAHPTADQRPIRLVLYGVPQSNPEKQSP
jgi:DNA-binding transcriptional ArsR family regulator